MRKFALLFCSLGMIFVSCSKKEVEKDTLENVMLKDSLSVFKKLYEESAYFSIDKNENAQRKFEPETTDKVMQKVIQDFTELNIQEGGNPLIPQEFSSTAKINKVSVINHQWMILDFYSDNNVGELLIKYNYNPESTTTFTVIDSVVY